MNWINPSQPIKPAIQVMNRDNHIESNWKKIRSLIFNQSNIEGWNKKNSKNNKKNNLS